MNEFLKGYLASSVGLIVSYPVDTIKVYIQNQTRKITSKEAIIEIYKKGGKSFYRGIGSQLLFTTPFKSIRLMTYTTTKTYLPNDSIKSELIAGITAGATQSIFTNPIEVVKTRYQMHKQPIFQLHTMYHGFPATFIRDSIMTGVYFPVYTLLKKYNKNNLIINSTLATIPGCLLSVPFDVIKTRQQTNKEKELIRNMIKNEGIKSFFKGTEQRLLKAIPQLAITMTIFNCLNT
jgi:solute carrier family 25 aspartate/glutamate transporter 12/13